MKNFVATWIVKEETETDDPKKQKTFIVSLGI